jgi:hypothetical protein
MKAVVFLGPSLPAEQARGLLEAIYLPPAKQSDLLTAATIHRPDVIGLIDGVFLQSLSVWHKEILYALDQGIRVYGASSMGALRAAETAEFGTVGIGEIYRMYAEGELQDDDEVALAHGSEETGYSKLSEPMVNVRATLQAAHESGVIDHGTYETISAIAKEIYFIERTFPTIFARAAAAGIAMDVLTRLAGFVETSYVDLKRIDAIRLLETIRALPDSPSSPARNFDFARTSHFDTLYNRDRMVHHRGTDVPLEAVSSYVALHHPSFSELNFNALNRILVINLAKLLDVEVAEEEVDAEGRRFRASYDLDTDDDFASWRARNDLSEDEFRNLMTEVALCRRLQRWLLIARWMDRSTKPVLDQLRLQNEYTLWAQRTASQERLLQEGVGIPGASDRGGLSLAELLDDQREWADFRLDVEPSVWAEEAGFHTEANLKMELHRARLARITLLDLVARVNAADDARLEADRGARNGAVADAS